MSDPIDKIAASLGGSPMDPNALPSAKKSMVVSIPGGANALMGKKADQVDRDAAELGGTIMPPEQIKTEAKPEVEKKAVEPVKAPPLRLGGSRTFDFAMPENPAEHPDWAATVGLANDIATIPEKHPILTAAGMALPTLGVGAIPSALTLMLASTADKFAVPVAENPRHFPTFSPNDAAEVGVDTLGGLVFPGNGEINIPGLKLYKPPVGMVQNPATKEIEAATLSHPITPTQKPNVIPMKPGSGADEAVEEAGKDLGVYTTPGQRGSVGGERIEEGMNYHPIGKAINKRIINKQTDAVELGKDEILGKASKVEAGDKVRQSLQEAQQAYNEQHEALFSDVNDSALHNDKNIVEANTKISNALDSIANDDKITPERIAAGVVPLESGTIASLNTARAILENGKGGAAYDYHTLNLFRQKLGNQIGEAMQYGRGQDVKVLKKLRDAVTEAQANFLQPDKQLLWQKYKEQYQEYQKAHDILRPIIANQTADENVIDSIVKKPGGLDAALKYAEFNGDQQLVDRVKMAYLRDLVDNSTSQRGQTLKAFDASLKKLGKTQKEYFNDELTRRARGIVALEEAARKFEQSGEQASRKVIANVAEIAGFSGLAHAASGEWASGLGIGLGVYLAVGTITPPLYHLAVQVAESNAAPEIKAIAQGIVRSAVSQGVNGEQGSRANTQAPRLSLASQPKKDQQQPRPPLSLKNR